MIFVCFTIPRNYLWTNNKRKGKTISCLVEPSVIITLVPVKVEIGENIINYKIVLKSSRITRTGLVRNKLSDKFKMRVSFDFQQKLHCILICEERSKVFR